MSRPINGHEEYFRQTAWIGSGQVLGSAIEIAKASPRGIGVQVPSGFIGGNIALQVATTTAAGATWYTVKDNYNSAVVISGLATTTSGQIHVFPAGAWAVGCYPYARFASFSAGADGGSAQTTGLALQMLLLS